MITLAAHEVVTRADHRCASCFGVYPAGAPMLRYVGLESVEGGLVAFYLCPLCPWGTERRKPDWRRNVRGRFGPKSRSGRQRATRAREGTCPTTGCR